MPELPEVESLARFLAARMTGRRLSRVDLLSFAALKTVDPPPRALEGRTVAGTGRRGKFLVLFTAGPSQLAGAPPAGSGPDDSLCLVVHLARAGWIRWRDAAIGRASGAPRAPGSGPVALRLRLEDGSGFDVTEAGTQKRLAVYVVPRPEDVPGIATLGIEPFDPAFTVERLSGILRGRTVRIKSILGDQAVIAGVGNAYSDEALHVACLSPYRPAGELSAEEVERLHSSLLDTLSDAIERSAGLPASDLKAEKRAGMRVHGRTGQPCPVCGDSVREVAFAERSWQYCPTCQTGGRILADRRLSRLIK